MLLHRPKAYIPSEISAETFLYVALLSNRSASWPRVCTEKPDNTAFSSTKIVLKQACNSPQATHISSSVHLSDVKDSDRRSTFSWKTELGNKAAAVDFGHCRHYWCAIWAAAKQLRSDNDVTSLSMTWQGVSHMGGITDTTDSIL